MNGMTSKQGLLAKIALGIWLAGLASASAQVPRDAAETIRADLQAERKAVIAEGMNFTPEESDAFWPIYRKYRAEVDKATDRLVELIFEYGDLYPNVPDRNARELLNQYAKVEANLLKIKQKYLKKFAKVLPAAKVFRFAQLDNRFDLGIRVGLATAIPMLPVTQAASANTHAE